LPHQHQDHRGDHDLVGDRIEEHAELRDRALRARQIAVEIIGDAHQAVDREGDGIALRHSGHHRKAASSGIVTIRDNVRMLGKVSIEPRPSTARPTAGGAGEPGRPTQSLGHGLPRPRRKHLGNLLPHSLPLGYAPRSFGGNFRRLGARFGMIGALGLMRERRFLPLFVTQFLGAFNDNLFKNAMIFFATYQIFNSVEDETRSARSPPASSSCPSSSSPRSPASLPTATTRRRSCGSSRPPRS
jgi:hypothetical protein